MVMTHLGYKLQTERVTDCVLYTYTDEFAFLLNDMLHAERISYQNGIILFHCATIIN